MKNLAFYAEHPVLYKNSIIFTTNNTIYKFSRSKKTLESIFHSETPIKGMLISKTKLVFKTRINQSNDIFQIDLKTHQLLPITYLNNASLTALSLSEEELIYTNTEYNPHRVPEVFAYNFKKHTTTHLNLSKIYAFLKIGEDIIVQKNEYGHLNWKNYQGGRRGQIYKNNKPLIILPGQCLNPIHFNNRIYFIYNEEFKSSLVSCTLEGKDLQYHYTNEEYLISELHNQNHEIVFSLIGNLFIFNILDNTIQEITIPNKIIKNQDYQSISLNYLTSADINKDNIALAIRGNIFEKHLYSGGFNQITNTLRFTHTGYIDDILFGFKDGKETELHIYKNKIKPTIFKLEPQKIQSIAAQKKYIAYSNHKNELRFIDLEGKETIIDKAQLVIKYFEISMDHKWIVYEYPQENRTSIKIYSIENQKTYTLIDDNYYNYHPSIDPLNRYIVFMSNRNIQIEPDALKFDYTFIENNEAYYIPLIKEFTLLEPWKEPKTKGKSKNDDDDEKDKKNHTEIDPENFKDIANKITKINIEGSIAKVFAIKGDQLLAFENADDINIIAYHLKTLSQDTIIEECERAKLSLDKQHMIISINSALKIAKAGEKISETGYKNITIQPTFTSRTKEKDERQNIFHELSWMIQEFYWNPTKALFLKETLIKYEPHVNRTNTKQELHMVLNQMQSEMQTSHSYIFAPYPDSTKGSLCCDIKYHAKTKKFFVENILNNYSNCEHPIYNYNIPLMPGDIIKKINNIPLTQHFTYNEALLNKANQHISIEIRHTKSAKTKTYNIKLTTKENEQKLRYLSWLNENNKHVQNQSNNKIGYIHIPDMSEKGFTEFFISYLANYNKEAIIIDARYNKGGHVSAILIEQLYKKKLGFDIARHNPHTTFPMHASNNNFVLLINADTASDGEIFTEAFKQLKLGTVFGERTWGGIIGICPRNPLIDNLMTSQPEFKMEFSQKTNKEIENYGATPDIEIEDTWNTEYTPEKDQILNEAIKFCIENYIKKN